MHHHRVVSMVIIAKSKESMVEVEGKHGRSRSKAWSKPAACYAEGGCVGYPPGSV